MVDDARPRVLFSQEHLNDRLPVTRGKVVLLDGDASSAGSDRSTPPALLAGPEHLAYVIFTSGSTGRPKGVAMPHAPLCNLLAWQRSRFVHQGPRRTLQFTSPSFDVAFQEIFSTLVTGGTVVVVPDEARRDFDRLAALVDAERIERMFLPPLALGELARRLPAAPPSAPAVEVITAGERLEITPAVRALWRRRPGWSLDNHYGPTETHVVTAQRLEGDAAGWPQLPPIGRPIDNARVYVLDAQRAPVPIGVGGELFVGGVAVARGYLNQPKLTAERFLEDPFADRGARMYRTGDLGRWREDGSIEFLGRADDQVKIRGFRIEPGEVTAALTRHPHVAQAAVIADEDSTQPKRLVAYVVPADAASPSPSPRELRAFLAESLPDYMVPAAFVILPALPLTANGKLDRTALPAPDLREDLERAFAPAATDTEQRVAEIWAQVLGLERVGVDDNFFALGGHSLLAGDLVARCSRALGVSLPVRVLFGGPTVRQLAQAVEEARGTGTTEQAIPRARRRPISAYLDPSA
jgi:amino acid adenylation domain-containing protein